MVDKGVILEDDEVDAPVVVLVAGAWSRRLGLTAGVAIPMVARSIFAGVLQRPPAIKDHMVVIDRTIDTYFRPDTADLTLIRLGFINTQEQEAQDPEDAPTVITHESIAYSVDKISHRVPAMYDAGLRRTWMELDGFTPDGHCILGAAPGVEGLYMAVGFSGTGFNVGPAVGMCMAELITEGKAETVGMRP